MIAKYKFLIVSIILLGLVLFAPLAVKAQDELETLEGVSVDEVKSIPSGFGFWWRNVKEWTSLAFTFDPVKKAEKQLKFAEGRARLADYIIENSDDSKVQEKAEKMLEKANQYMQKIEERKDVLIEKADERSQKLLNNIAKHYLNKERIMEKIEDKIPVEKIEQFQQFRQTTGELRQGFLDNLQNNSNVPQEVKDKISDVLSQVQNVHQVREEIRAQQKPLLEEIKAGNVEARQQFGELRQERQQKKTQIQQQIRNNNPADN